MSKWSKITPVNDILLKRDGNTYKVDYMRPLDGRKNAILLSIENINDEEDSDSIIWYYEEELLIERFEEEGYERI